MRQLTVLGLTLALLFSTALLAQKKPKEVFTDPNDADIPADFKFQGEYAPAKGDPTSYAVQVIALGGGQFQGVVCKGGLPGAGWDGKNKSLMAGKIDGEKVVFKPISDKEKRNYLAGPADKFSATSKFPPPGHTEMAGVITGNTLKLETPGGKTLALTKTVRVSPTMGAKPPKGALVLFDGKSKDAWTGGRVDAKTGFLNTDGHDIRTKKKFNDYTVHAEFLLPYRPAARGQGRGNSGFYQVDMYDITFTNAVMEGGKKTKNARITVKLNGVVVHDDVEIKGKTGGARGDAEGTPGPLQLQGHGNPLQFRNIWVVEKK
jgi:hypothetical protein